MSLDLLKRIDTRLMIGGDRTAASDGSEFEVIDPATGGVIAMVASGTPETLSASQDPYVRQFLDGAVDGPVAFHYPETPAFERWMDKQGGRA